MPKDKLEFVERIEAIANNANVNITSEECS
jgi:hypothetical protein